MGFVNEQVGEENKDLWESIGWKDWGERTLGFRAKRYWCADKKRSIYMQPIGGFIDMPNYYDLAYKGRIVRMEIGQHGNGNRVTGFNTVWLIKHVYIPKSLWDEKEDVILAIKEAFMANRSGRSEHIVKSIDIEFCHEPECVEVDYNGR